MIDLRKLAFSGRLGKIGFVQRYSENEFFFHEGDQGSDMYVILAGKVSINIKSSEGQHINIAALKPGDMFGEMSFLEGLPRSATAKALEDSLVVVINQSNFEKVFKRQPFIARSIMKELSRRIRKQNDEIKHLKMQKQEKC